MSIFGIFLFFSQIDFLFIRMVADLIVTVYTNIWWMQDKIVDKAKHDLEGGWGDFAATTRGGDTDNNPSHKSKNVFCIEEQEDPTEEGIVKNNVQQRCSAKKPGKSNVCRSLLDKINVRRSLLNTIEEGIVKTNVQQNASMAEGFNKGNIRGSLMNRAGVLNPHPGITLVRTSTEDENISLLQKWDWQKQSSHITSE